MSSALWCMVLLVLTFKPAAAAPSAPDSSEIKSLLSRMGERFGDAQSVQGRFSQTYTHRVLRRTVREEGRLLLSPPQRIRWEYTAPEEKLFVAAGRFAWFYVPADTVAYSVLHADLARLSDEARNLLSRAVPGLWGMIDILLQSPTGGPNSDFQEGFLSQLGTRWISFSRGGPGKGAGRATSTTMVEIRSSQKMKRLRLAGLALTRAPSTRSRFSSSSIGAVTVTVLGPRSIRYPAS